MASPARRSTRRGRASGVRRGLLLALLLLVLGRRRYRPCPVAAAFLREPLPRRGRTTAGGPVRTARHNAQFRPLDAADWPERFPAGEHCSRCGLCETSFVAQVREACAFLVPPGPGTAPGSRLDALEARVHGRRRRGLQDDLAGRAGAGTAPADEARFGVLQGPLRLATGHAATIDGGGAAAQWTGLVTSLALALLESGRVDAVVCVAAADGDWSRPEPIVARTRAEVLRGRGVKPALAPALAVLDEVHRDPMVRRLLFCGVGCAVQALRAVEHRLDLDELYVLGTNCADNSPTPEAARAFVAAAGLGLGPDRGATSYEFMPDFRVHAKVAGGAAYTRTPYFCLPGTLAEASIARSCRACFDYTNALADVVVGYMAAPPLRRGARMEQSPQTLTVRNGRGADMVRTALEGGYVQVAGEASGSGAHDVLALATVESDALVKAMIGATVSEAGMPGWLGEIMALVVQHLGPKGVSFARYSIDYHILRNYLHVLNEWGEERAQKLTPEFSSAIIKHYVDMPDGKLRILRDKILQKKSLNIT